LKYSISCTLFSRCAARFPIFFFTKNEERNSTIVSELGNSCGYAARRYQLVITYRQ